MARDERKGIGATTWRSAAFLGMVLATGSPCRSAAAQTSATGPSAEDNLPALHDTAANAAARSWLLLRAISDASPRAFRLLPDTIGPIDPIALASMLQVALSLPTGDTLRYDPVQSAQASGGRLGSRAMVWQHFHAGIAVEGSGITLERIAQGPLSLRPHLRRVVEPSLARWTGTQAVTQARRYVAAAVTERAARRGSPLTESTPSQWAASAAVAAYVPYGKDQAHPAFRVTVPALARTASGIGEVTVSGIDGAILSTTPAVVEEGDDEAWVVAPPAMPTYVDDTGSCILPPPHVDLDASVFGAGALVAQAYAGTSTPLVRLRDPARGITAFEAAGLTADTLQGQAWYAWTAFIARYYDCPQLKYQKADGYEGNLIDANVAALYLGAQRTYDYWKAHYDYDGYDGVYGPLYLLSGTAVPGSCGTATSLHQPDAAAVVQCPLARDDGAYALSPQHMGSVAHELVHARLIARKYAPDEELDSGAIHEGLADVLGREVEYAFVGGAPWIVTDGDVQALYELHCKQGHAEYCGRVALSYRSLSDPKGGTALDAPGLPVVEPGPTAYGGAYFNNLDPHRRGLVVGYAYYLMATGKSGYIDDDASHAYYSVRAMPYDIATDNAFHATLALKPGDDMEKLAAISTQYAAQVCGAHANETYTVRSAWFATNVGASPGVPELESHYVYPPYDATVPRIVAFAAETGEDAVVTYPTYEFQVGTSADFSQLVAQGEIDADIKGQLHFKRALEAGTEYWWRLRPKGAAWSQLADHADACWRPAQRFFTSQAPASVTDMSPAGDTADNAEAVEPWGVRFSFSAVDWADGYDYFVDYADPPHPPYLQNGVDPAAPHAYDQVDNLLVLAHGSLLAATLAEQPNGVIELPRIAMPKSAHLRWMVRPFFLLGEEVVYGDAHEQFFDTLEPVTRILNPAPQDGDDLAEVAAQPLTVEYYAAAYSARRRFALEGMELTPTPQVPLPYLDDEKHFPAANIDDEPDTGEATLRTHQRMLPVQLDAGANLNYTLTRVQLRIEADSPWISAVEAGGTYKPSRESVHAQVDFRPAAPSILGVTPFVFEPVASNSCSDPTTNELTLAWLHGPAATQTAVSTYRIELFPENCGNRNHPQGLCQLLPNEGSFDPARTVRRDIGHNPLPPGGAQSITFSRQTLFPSQAEEQDEDVTGFLVHLKGISSEEPGPKGLNITGTFVTDLPAPPADLDVLVVFDNGHPRRFVAVPRTRKNAAHDESYWSGPYVSDSNTIDMKLFDGPGCDAAKEIASSQPGENTALRIEGDPGYPKGAHPVVSARARLAWENCPVMESPCRTVQGTNPNAAPDPVSGLQPEQQTGLLGASWDAPGDDPDPAAIRYEVSLSAAGNLPGNILAHQPVAPSILLRFDAAAFGERIGVWLASLAPEDAGKVVILTVMACRAGPSSVCSEPRSVTFPIPGAPAGDATADLDAGMVQFDLGFLGGFAATWSGSSTPALIDHYRVGLNCQGVFPPLDRSVRALDVLSSSQVYGGPDPAGPHAGWQWTPLLVAADPPYAGWTVQCTVDVRACSSADESVCGDPGTDTRPWTIGAANGCEFVGWSYTPHDCEP